MSGTDECQSTVSEAQISGSNVYTKGARKTKLDNTQNMIGKVDSKLEDNLNGNNYLLNRYTLSSANVDIMDSEISSITSKEGAATEGTNSCNETDENEDKSLDTTAFSGKVSNDFETAALSPCFPLIRDKEDLEMPSKETESGTNVGYEHKCDTDSSAGNLEYHISYGNKEFHAKEGISDKLEQLEAIHQESVCNDEKDAENKASDHIGVFYEEDKGTEENKFKDNIVSSSMDKNNDVSNEKDGRSPTTDIW